MRGKDFIDRLEAAFPGILKAAYAGLRYSDESDEAVFQRFRHVALCAGAKLTPDVLSKARGRLGLVSRRQPHRRNGVRPAIPPAPTPEPPIEQQLPLAESAVEAPITDLTVHPEEAFRAAQAEWTRVLASAQRGEIAGLQGIPEAGRGLLDVALSPDTVAIVHAIDNMKGAFLSQLSRLENRLEAGKAKGT